MALASHLIFTLNIPARNNQLIFILGDGSEPDNHQAITHWVLTKISHIQQWPLPADEVHPLISELETELRDLLSDIQQGRFYV